MSEADKAGSSHKVLDRKAGSSHYEERAALYEERAIFWKQAATANMEIALWHQKQSEHVREALTEMLRQFGNPKPEEYIDGGASYELARQAVAKAREALDRV